MVCFSRGLAKPPDQIDPDEGGTSEASDAAAGRTPADIPLEERGQFLFDYMQLLLDERVEEAAGFRRDTAHRLTESGTTQEIP